MHTDYGIPIIGAIPKLAGMPPGTPHFSEVSRIITHRQNRRHFPAMDWVAQQRWNARLAAVKPAIGLVIYPKQTAYVGRDAKNLPGRKAPKRIDTEIHVQEGVKNPFFSYTTKRRKKVKGLWWKRPVHKLLDKLVAARQKLHFSTPQQRLDDYVKRTGSYSADSGTHLYVDPRVIKKLNKKGRKTNSHFLLDNIPFPFPHAEGRRDD